MITFDQNKFNEYFEQYQSAFESNIENELFKWRAVEHFQKTWNVDAEDFTKMLDDALSKTNNLLTSFQFFPKTMLLNFSKADENSVREMFRRLFDESQDLYDRIQFFISQSVHLLGKMKNMKNHFQNLNSISTYLWLRYPEKYHIYKYTEIRNACELLHCSFKPTKGLSNETVLSSFEFLDELAKCLQKNEAFRIKLRAYLSEDCYKDENLHIAVSDFIYFLNTVHKTKDNIGRFWWLNANPSIWSAGEQWMVGSHEDFSLYNENGNKRHVYKYFLEAKKGDKVICYDLTPTKKIVALAEVFKENDGKSLWFKKTCNLSSPIGLDEFKDLEELQEMEILKNPKGTLFKLTRDEYETLMNLIRKRNTIPSIPILEESKGVPDSETEEQDSDSIYTESDFLQDVFISKEDLHTLEKLLQIKKNVILQGAPGVGKTFSAKRLAYKMMGCKDEERIKYVQFHQNYSYEDFVMGYRPTETGFVLRNGIFYEFCIKAANHPDKEYFLIIDEINRGNLSKIFGELLMLIENSYRGEKVALAYNGNPFYVPKNLYIIGMMNTADRSLAMMDYALRRRFSFFKMRPGFESEGFKAMQEEISSARFNHLIQTVQELNSAIREDASLGEGFEIGHSYFCPVSKEDVMDAERLKVIVEYDLIPMLEEYWFDNKPEFEKWSDRLRKALND